MEQELNRDATRRMQSRGGGSQRREGGEGAEDTRRGMKEARKA